MNLLLQLDTIQGLHPSLREVRKSVASDLVHLQDKLDQLYSQTTKKQEGETQKEEISSRNNTASSISSNSVEKTPLIENISSDQPPHLKEENVSVQESGGSSITSDKLSCVSFEDYDLPDPEGQRHAVPVKMLNDEVVPSGDGKNVTRHNEDENDKQDDNLLSAETKASIDEKSMSQDVVVHSPQIEISETVKAPGLNDLKHNSNQANPSNSFLAGQQINAPDEKDKQSLSEELALKAELASEKGIFMEEGSDIKPEDAIAEQNEEAIVEESNVMRDAFDASEDLKPSFKYDKNELHITSVASSGKIDLKETASDSSDETSSECNLAESSQHEKNMSDASLQD